MVASGELRYREGGLEYAGQAVQKWVGVRRAGGAEG